MNLGSIIERLGKICRHWTFSLFRIYCFSTILCFYQYQPRIKSLKVTKFFTRFKSAIISQNVTNVKRYHFKRIFVQLHYPLLVMSNLTNTKYVLGIQKLILFLWNITFIRSLPSQMIQIKSLVCIAFHMLFNLSNFDRI